ncbi:MAG: GNAT family N-acetyltransferase [Bdellovibrionia bacterium]
MNPILLDIPVPITTERLILRPSQAGDGAGLNEALLESWDEFHKWLPFAKVRPTVDESEENVRRSYARWILREDLRLLIFEKSSGKLAGSTGLHRMKWEVPSFEIGYWVRNSFVGRGFITEATNALTRYCFEQLKAKRVELRYSATNDKSIKIAKRLGFELEGLLRADHKSPDGEELRDTYVYSRLTPNGLPPLQVSW